MKQNPLDLIQAKILIVDDEPSASDYLRLLLEGEGFEVRTTANGIEALIALDAEVAHLRAQLKSGEPCPVCGANEHTTASVAIDIPETVQKATA